MRLCGGFSARVQVFVMVMSLYAPENTSGHVIVPAYIWRSIVSTVFLNEKPVSKKSPCTVTATEPLPFQEHWHSHYIKTRDSTR